MAELRAGTFQGRAPFGPLGGHLPLSQSLPCPASPSAIFSPQGIILVLQGLVKRIHIQIFLVKIKAYCIRKYFNFFFNLTRIRYCLSSLVFHHRTLYLLMVPW